MRTGAYHAALLVFSFFAFGPSVIGQQLSDPSLALKAHKCHFVLSVEWNRHDTGFRESAESNDVAAAVLSSALYRHYTEVSAAHADLIFSIDDDAFSNTVTLKVLNPDDNSTVYSESRDRIAVDNDVKRLIEHFLKAVDDARDAQASTATTPGDARPSYDRACQTSASPAQFTAMTGQPEAVCDTQAPEAPEIPASAPQPTGSVLRGDGPSYLWVARYDDEDLAQDASRKIQDLGLTSVVIPRPAEDGKRVFVVFSGPFPPARIPSVIDWLRTQGFSNAREVKMPSLDQMPTRK